MGNRLPGIFAQPGSPWSDRAFDIFGGPLGCESKSEPLLRTVALGADGRSRVSSYHKLLLECISIQPIDSVCLEKPDYYSDPGSSPCSPRFTHPLV